MVEQQTVGGLNWRPVMTLSMGLFTAAALLISTPGCTVTTNEQPRAGAPAQHPECRTSRKECVQYCRDETRDSASRNACFNKCMHDVVACKKRDGG